MMEEIKKIRFKKVVGSQISEQLENKINEIIDRVNKLTKYQKQEYYNSLK